jgi:hypothetical protein
VRIALSSQAGPWAARFTWVARTLLESQGHDVVPLGEAQVVLHHGPGEPPSAPLVIKTPLQSSLGPDSVPPERLVDGGFGLSIPMARGQSLDASALRAALGEREISVSFDWVALAFWWLSEAELREQPRRDNYGRLTAALSRSRSGPIANLESACWLDG